MDNASVLVLNATYEAINICDVRRAIRLILSGTAHCVEKGKDIIRSPSCYFPIPEVIRLNYYVSVPYKEVTFCRKNILIRDNHTCQYCGQSYPPEELTIDHILPLSRGGGDSWNNVVTACRQCNTVKGNHLPNEIGMPLLKKPRSFTPVAFLYFVRHHGNTFKSWRKYLFYH